ncbi:hypothetical protein GT347_02755 [Xylophilus rhododendri]|uniref:Uncharacterized protein n=1 Tax=Xylophilus rhododendri TaxID=2697032 RepID=A0A857J1G5_9BURK|nr:hypothetical protein [Xylophilus rhododendri]QHI96999.1 hypothetical protein GT347_02755 [Xylophilus rhododendri]
MATYPPENNLPLEPSAYRFEMTGRATTVRVVSAGEIVYGGAGSVEGLECPVPF